MALLESIPACRRIDTGRSDLVAFDIVGHVSAADIENLLGLLEGAFALSDRVDLLLRLSDPEGVDWSEVDTETLIEGQGMVAAHVKKIAVVGDSDWITGSAGFLGARDGVQTKRFAPEDEAAAWAWLEAEPPTASE